MVSGGFMQFPKDLVKMAITAFALTAGALAHGQNAWNFPEFSATQVFESHKANMSMKVHLSGSSVRVDRSPTISALYVPSKSMVYELTTYPDQSHQCVAMKPEQARMLPSPLELLQGSDVKRTPAGSEVVEGHPTKVEDVVVTRPDGTTIKSRVWEAEDLKGIPVKIESHLGEMTLSAVYRDISLSPPDSGLFTPPARCTALENMWQVAETAK
jgi:hypothetical protein